MGSMHKRSSAEAELDLLVLSSKSFSRAAFAW